MQENLTGTIFSSQRRNGSIALYAIVFILFGLLMSIFIFFPQFLNMQSGIYNISCREIRQKIRAAIEEYDVNNTRSIIERGKKVDLDTLKEKGFLFEIRLCPDKGEYKFDERGRVVCTVHVSGE